jgi:hypothetical protein
MLRGFFIMGDRNMKKILFGFIGCLCAVDAFSMDTAANVMPTFSGAQRRETDPRPLVNQVQLALLESIQGVGEVLEVAEGSYPGYTTGDFSTVEGSFAGLSGISVSNDIITFTFNPTEINANLNMGTLGLEYTPIVDGVVTGWTCLVTQTPSFGSTFVAPSAGSHPVTSGLGWPYEECTVS